MQNRPYEEPCGCHWGSADHPFKLDENDLSKLDNEYEYDPRLQRFTECIECGAVWTTKQDNVWVRTGENASW